MNKSIKHLSIVLASAIFAVAGCATIVNDPMIPLAVNFSDGSSGKCDFENKRGTWSSELPTTNLMIRRSDDALVYDCTTEDGREASGSIRSEVEGEKMAASVIFWDLGITDAITDKHRTYQGNIIIPVLPKKDVGDEAGNTDEPDEPDDIYTKLEKLNELKDRGIITEEEFAAEKKKLLESN
jgi:hypothetical protein